METRVYVVLARDRSVVEVWDQEHKEAAYNRCDSIDERTPCDIWNVPLNTATK